RALTADRLAAVAVGLVAFVAYALTAYRSVPGGDSGELIGAVASGGVIHPPGYLLSASCDALAAGVLTLAVTRAARSPAGGIVAGGLFAFAPGVWRYAIAAE